MVGFGGGYHIYIYLIIYIYLYTYVYTCSNNTYIHIQASIHVLIKRKGIQYSWVRVTLTLVHDKKWGSRSSQGSNISYFHFSESTRTIADSHFGTWEAGDKTLMVLPRLDDFLESLPTLVRSIELSIASQHSTQCSDATQTWVAGRSHQQSAK